MYDDARFARALRDASAFAKVSESDLAEMLGVSRPTILLWKSGVSKPHRAIRETVKQVLVNIVEEMGDDE
jgi:DNA-binding transcriptional regulator YiaG